MCTLSQLFSSLHLIFFSLELKIIGESFQCVRFDVWGFLRDLLRKVWNYEGIKMMTCLRILAGVSSKLSASEIENHLEQGKRLLSSGQLSDALVHYHAAVGKQKSCVFYLDGVVHFRSNRTGLYIPCEFVPVRISISCPLTTVIFNCFDHPF